MGEDRTVQWYRARAGSLRPVGQIQLAGCRDEAVLAHDHAQLFSHHPRLLSPIRQS